jgi:predicted N-formylglutamate amidohydrolase
MQQNPENFSEAEVCESYEIVPGAPETGILIICDHASNFIPPSYGTLGLDDIQLSRHIAYDIGALAVARELGARLKATVISSRFSRLLIDPNRGEDDPTLIMRISDGAIVPGNATLTQAERDRRIASFYRPYHEAITAETGAMAARGLVPAIVSIHSFTEAWRGAPRKWHAAILWDNDPRLPLPLLRELRQHTSFEIGDNEPYSGRLRNDSIFRHATMRGLPNALIEVRQDLVRGEKDQSEWAELIANCLTAIFSGEESAGPLSCVEYRGSKTDIEISRPAVRG